MRIFNDSLTDLILPYNMSMIIPIKYETYFDIIYEISEKTMSPVISFHRKNHFMEDPVYSFKLTGTEIQDKTGGYIKMLLFLDQIIREEKLNELGI